MRARRWTQVAAVFAANPWFVYLSNRTIYQGKAKGLCFPGFNCYACPLAVFSCPIGALQHSMAIMSPKNRVLSAAGLGGTESAGPHGGFSFAPFLYVVGFMGLIGVIFGRLACGWICPFGFLQDMLYKIPTPKLRLPAWARFGKYGTLAILAVLVPYLTGVHWFSRLCPAGALEGAIPLKLLPLKTALPATGWFYWLKIGILVAFLVWMVITKRPFCRTACPLGATWSLLTPVSMYGMQVDKLKCTKCGDCRSSCPVDINVYENANSPECVRCLDCKRVCPEGAVTSGFKAAGSPDALPEERGPKE